jgi:hypothetical protein
VNRSSGILASPDAAATGIALALLALFGWFALRGGGFDIEVWGLGGIAVIALLVVVVVGAGGLPRKPTRTETIAVIAFSGLALWSFASVLWARVPGDAWTGADRMLLYVAIFVLVLVMPWRRPPALILLAGYACVIAVVACVAVVRARNGDVSFFLWGRLSFPVGYPNANAALYLSGYWVAVMLATRKGIAVPLRAGLLGIAAALPVAALLAQSRGSLVAFPLTALLIAAVVPGRVRTGIGIVLTLLPVIVVWGETLAVRDVIEASGGEAAGVLTEQLWAMGIGAVALAMVGGIWGVVDGRVDLSVRARRRIAIVAAVVAVAAAAGLTALIAASSPVDRARTGWSDFTAVSTGGGIGSGLGTNRYDFWRVAVTRFRDEPVIGIGSDNFAHDYILMRRSLEVPKYPHSIEAQIVSQLGIIGAGLALVCVAAIGAAALPRRRDRPETVALAGAALAPVVYWMFHASVDWFWEIPGVTAPAVALAALAMSLRSGVRAPMPLPRTGVVGVACGAAVAVAVLALPWSADRMTAHAITLWRSDPQQAYSALDRAAKLDVLSAAPYVAAGAIAARKGEHARMETYFTRAVARDPDNWYLRLELALAAAAIQDRRVALREIAEAVRLNPLEPVLRDVESKIRQGVAIDPTAYDSLFAERVVGGTS